MTLQRHLAALAGGPHTPAAATAVVVGAGLTGIETACELPARLTALFPDIAPRVVLVDHNPHVGSDMGSSARPVIEAALSATGVESRLGVSVTAVDEGGATLSTGEVLAASTVVWCAGMRANPLTADLGVPRDRLGRVPVDDYLRVNGVQDVFAAGDVAAAQMDDTHVSVMSCQHGRPMGRFAGYNVISDLLGEPMLTLRIPWYVTVLDLGPAGAVYTEGWDRQVVASGASKQRPPSAQSTPSESIHRWAATGTRFWPPPRRRCSRDRAPRASRRRAGAASARSAGWCRTCLPRSPRSPGSARTWSSSRTGRTETPAREWACRPG